LRGRAIFVVTISGNSRNFRKVQIFAAFSEIPRTGFHWGSPLPLVSISAEAPQPVLEGGFVARGCQSIGLAPVHEGLPVCTLSSKCLSEVTKNGRTTKTLTCSGTAPTLSHLAEPHPETVVRHHPRPSSAAGESTCMLSSFDRLAGRCGVQQVTRDRETSASTASKSARHRR